MCHIFYVLMSVNGESRWKSSSFANCALVSSNWMLLIDAKWYLVMRRSAELSARGGLLMNPAPPETKIRLPMTVGFDAIVFF